MSAKQKDVDLAENDDKDIVQEKATINAFDTKLILAQKIISRLKEELASLELILNSRGNSSEIEEISQNSNTSFDDMVISASDNKIIEGVFDGQNMVGSDGRVYNVPPNYASKSKLVEGDILKLTIQPNGSFVFKQIGPIERQRVVGTLMRDDLTNDWKVMALGKKFNLLTAAVSYHKGDVGDDAVILVPESAPSKWAALENVVKRV